MESVTGTPSKIMSRRFLARLRPRLAAFSFVTGSSFLIRQLEWALAQQIGRMYNQRLTSRKAQQLISKIDIRAKERWSWFLEITFFVPAVGNFIKAAVGAQLAEAIGSEIIRSFEREDPHCRWNGLARNNFRRSGTGGKRNGLKKIRGIP